MILKDTHITLNLFMVCSLLGFIFDLLYRLIVTKSLMAAFIPAFLFSPLYGLTLSLYVSIKPDSSLIEFIMIISILHLLETIKPFISSFLIPNSPKLNRTNLFRTMIIWAFFFASFSEWIYPWLADAIRIMPYSYCFLFVYGLLFVSSVYLMQRILKELNKKIEGLLSIHSARSQMITAENEIIHGMMEMSINTPHEGYLKAVHEECMFDMTNLDGQYEEALLKLSPIEQKLIKAYLVSVPVRRKQKM